MQLRLTVGPVLTAILLDNATSRGLLSLLPLTLTLSDYARTENVSGLPRRLSTDGAPEGHDPAAGDVTYYAPWGQHRDLLPGPPLLARPRQARHHRRRHRGARKHGW
jgi:hypothetical protein